MDFEGDEPSPKRHRAYAHSNAKAPAIFLSESEDNDGSDDGNITDKASEVARLGESAVFLSDSEECDDIIQADSSDPVADNNSDEFTISSETDLEEVAVQLDCPMEQLDDDEELERKALVTLFTSKCCSKDCLLHLTGYDIINARRKVCDLSPNSKRKWLFDKVSDSSRLVGGKLLTTFNLAGQGLCNASFCLLYSVNSKRLYRVMRSISEGNISCEHGNKGRRKKSTKSEPSVVWMQRYFDLIGDKMPHNNQIHLPSWETQKSVYERFREDMAIKQIKEVVSLSMFYKLWNDEFPHVVIPEQNRFAKCDICVKLKMERKEHYSKDKKKTVDEQLKVHLERVETERKKYHHHREKARSDPEKFMTIILDGMDQQKTNLPNTTIISKSSSNLWRLRTHITGVLVHTKAPCGKLAYVFVDMLQWPHDSNLTVTVLLKTLNEFRKDHTTLPGTLYLQMDNTARENKNRFVLTFCAILVQLGIFKKVQINFLPVGHTHEDIDQMFSRIAEEIRKTGCESIPDLLSVIHRSSTPNPQAELLEGVWDCKAWIDPYLGNLENHSKYHIYRFTIGTSGKVEMHYKQYSSMPWEPQKDGVQLPGIQLLQSCPDVTDAAPLVCPSTAKLDLEHLLRDLPKYQPWLSTTSWRAWEEFIANSDQLSVVNPDIPWILPILKSAAVLREDSTTQSHQHISAETLQLIGKETRIPNMITVRHPKRKKNSTSATSNTVGTQHNEDNAETLSVKVGDIVACFLEKYADEEPQIGEVLKVYENSDLEINWYTGSYSDPWEPCKTRHGGSQYNLWTEVIPTSAILCDIKLSRASRLSMDDKKKLKSIYSNIQ